MIEQAVGLAGRFMILVTLCITQISTGLGGDISYVNWSSYGGDKSQNKYSVLTQINAENVNRLRVAWRYDTGDADETSSQIQCNPIIIDGVLYGTTSKLKVFAINAVTGEQQWQFDPFRGEDSGQGINRGLSYWQEDNDKRILFTAGPYLYALHAGSGKLIQSFGLNGKVDLRLGLGEKPELLHVDVTTPGAIYQDLIILGSRVTETPAAAPGYIRAFNVKTGTLVWVFHTIPQPGEYGHETWPQQAWKSIGGANSWAGMSVDQERGLVFAPTGSPAYDFYGGERAGDNLFANSVLALDASTGKRRWHFQTVHHDLWDRDLPAPPNLVVLKHGDNLVDAVAQVTKSGFVFVLNRDTGQPLFAVEERPVPMSKVKGEKSSPTQPIPQKPPPFTRQFFNQDNASAVYESSEKDVLRRLKGFRTGGPFLPPDDDRPTIIFPGFDGGAHWGGAAFDPETGKLYVNATELPFTYKLVKIASDSGNPGKTSYQKQCGSCHGLDRLGNTTDVPSLMRVRERLSSTQIENIIRRGKGRMTGFPQLSYEEVLLILDYLNTPETEITGHNNAAKLTENGSTKSIYLHSGQFPFFDKDGYPAIKPPWGTLTAIDLNKGEINWQIPLGEYPELVQKGIRNTGAINYGGAVVTRGGLIFIAATADRKFRAFDKHSGKLLWETDLPASGFATPSVYAVNGRQFVVIAAGGGKFGQISSGEYIAFSL